MQIVALESRAELMAREGRCERSATLERGPAGRLKDAAEKAKCELSSVRETEVNLPFIISSGRNEALHLQRTLTRATLEELSEDLIERTVDICKQTLEDAKLGKDEIEESFSSAA